MKQKTYSGKGIASMINTCWYHNLDKFNSKVHVKDDTDLDSEWTIIVNK